jgi:hypothetical protein
MDSNAHLLSKHPSREETMAELNNGTEPQGEKAVEKGVLKHEELDLVQGGCRPCSDPTQPATLTLSPNAGTRQETPEKLELMKEREAEWERQIRELELRRRELDQLFENHRKSR